MSNLKYWLALSSVEGLGVKRARELSNRFGSVEALFSASIKEIVSRGALNPLIAQKILQAKEKLDSLELAISNLNSKDQIECICIDDETYPRLLRLIDDPPLVLYKKGRLSDFNFPSVAIVGTRHPTALGVETAKVLAGLFADLGFTIVSGLAAGIDTLAHKGAIESAGNSDEASESFRKTIAILGCGLKSIYPKSNLPLAEAISSKGALISEFSPYEPVSSSRLVRRNRLISGLSLGIIVVEAGFDRGSIHTAKFAISQSRQLYACRFKFKSDAADKENRADKIAALSELTRLGASLIEIETEIDANSSGFQGKGLPLKVQIPPVKKIAAELKELKQLKSQATRVFQGELFSGD